VRVQLLTVTRGDGLFTTFGHTVLRFIEEGDGDGAEGADRVYDWGTYDVTDAMLAVKFFVGELMYRVDTATTPVALKMYDRWFGGVVAQDLGLTPAQTAALQGRIREIFGSGDRAYAYHYFDDNCTTRVRDLLDEVLGGALSAATRGQPADGDTYRTLIVGSLPDNAVVRWAVYGMLNGRIDVPVDRWQRMFLPVWLMTELDGLRVPGPDGALRPVVTQRALLQGREPAMPLPVPSLAPWLALLAVLLVAGLLPGLWPARRAARVAAGAWLALLGFVGGFHGALQALAWAIAPYVESHANGNLLAVHPLTLALVVLGPRAAAGRPRALRVVRAGLLVQVVVLLVALALRTAGLIVQHIEGFALPVVAAAAAGWWTLGRLGGARQTAARETMTRAAAVRRPGKAVTA
jgi:hypothetical protein